MLDGVQVAGDPRAAEPDRALVFELIGRVDRFDVAIQALGFEWLSSEDLEASEEDEEESSSEGAPSAKVLYLTMPTAKAMRELLSMWREYKCRGGVNPPLNMAPLWNMFSYLRDLRGWSAQDRIDPGIAKYVEVMLAGDPNREVTIEFSFWYRSSRERRGESLATLDAMLQTTGGHLLDVVEIPEIQYQGALAAVPAWVARELRDQVSKLAELNDVMTIRPQSSFAVQVSEAEESVKREFAPPVFDPSGPCIAALLDGFPISAHVALNNRLHVHPVDIKAEQAPVNLRSHGTAMASLILHGDLHGNEPPVSRKVTVVPVLTGDPASGFESTPREKLPIGVIYRALKAIVAADPTTEPDLANITIVNHSIGDTMAPFVRRPSPWAALLDYFAHHHRLLFVISAGNIESSIPVSYASLADFDAADPLEREAAIMLALWKARGQRGLLCPAESINGLTVGALHADGSPIGLSAAEDPYPRVLMPNLASAVGFGANRSIKPEVLHQGGRFAITAASASDGTVSISARAHPNVGQRVATTSVLGDLEAFTNSCGTSNAAALTTRAGIQLADALDIAYAGDTAENHWLKRRTRAVLLKSLIAHGCSWGAAGRVLEEMHRDVYWSNRRDTISKLMGYGAQRIDRILSGADNRITLIADDVIRHEQLHEYLLPIPKAMLQNKDVRTITVTLSWSTPIRPSSADYRSVALKLVNRDGKTDFWGGIDRKNEQQPNLKTTERGTLLHTVLRGETLQRRATVGEIFVGVQALSKHPSTHHEYVPYALAITIEVAQSARVTDLYNEVAQGIRQPIRDTVRIGGRT